MLIRFMEWVIYNLQGGGASGTGHYVLWGWLGPIRFSKTWLHGKGEYNIDLWGLRIATIPIGRREKAEVAQEIEFTREEAMQKLREQINNYDIQVAHYEADWVLCKLLVALGYEDVVRLYQQVDKWYA